MAINYASQICESNALTATTRMTLSANAKAGALLTLGISALRPESSGQVDIVSITDSMGNPWSYKYFQSSWRFSAICWAQTSVVMQSGVDWIEVKLDGTQDETWFTGHTFEGAGPTKIDMKSTSGTGTTASRSVTVSGSDFLVLTHVTFAYDTTTTSPLNSMTERDSYTGSRIQGEFMSRNHTTGSSFTGGTTLGASRYWSATSVSFPYLAMPASAKSVPFLVGI